MFTQLFTSSFKTTVSWITSYKDHLLFIVSSFSLSLPFSLFLSSIKLFFLTSIFAKSFTSKIACRYVTRYAFITSKFDCLQTLVKLFTLTFAYLTYLLYFSLKRVIFQHKLCFITSCNILRLAHSLTKSLLHLSSSSIFLVYGKIFPSFSARGHFCFAPRHYTCVQ